VSVDYIPPPTIEDFMLDESLVRVIVGPVGSGKSMGCILELLRRARQQEPDSSGNRCTRFAIVRNTGAQLRTTVLPDVKQYLSPMIRYFVTDATIQIRAQLDDGTTVVSDWIMIPLDTQEDTQRLLSMQLTGAWINECREAPIGIVSALIGRLGRFPSKINGGPSWFGLICDTNPWDVDSPWHERLVLHPETNWRLFHQPSGIGPQAENTENLPPSYYENLMSDRDDGWSDVHVKSEWGISNAGQAVFRRSFDPTEHARDMKAIVNPNRPIMVGLDFGRTPCALISQTDNYGRLLVFREVVTEGMGIIQMAEEHLRPVLTADPFVGKRVFIVADPAGRDKGQITEESPFDALRSMGFLVYPAPTNAIGPRLLSVEKAFRSRIAGEPGLQISREGCPVLITALGQKYRYRKKKDGALEDTPEKLHPWSDVADCLQYICMGSNANYTGRVLARAARINAAPRPRMSAAGWT
jgi:hypothetical protein